MGGDLRIRELGGIEIEGEGWRDVARIKLYRGRSFVK